MVDTNTPTDWRKLREFAAVDLTRSFILSWHLESETVLIDIDLFLTEEHPFYEKPRPSEKVCIRPAIIEFPFCDSLTIDGVNDGEIQDLVDELGHGAISGLQRHQGGHYEIVGEFAKVTISAERPILRLKGP